MEHSKATTNRLRERSKAMVERTRVNVLRARAAAIRTRHVIQTAGAIRYENHLIRRLKP